MTTFKRGDRAHLIMGDPQEGAGDFVTFNGQACVYEVLDVLFQYEQEVASGIPPWVIVRDLTGSVSPQVVQASRLVPVDS